MTTGPNPPMDSRRLLKLAKLAVGIVLLVVALLVVPPWVVTFWSSLPRSVTRGLAIGFLWTLLASYAIAMVAALVSIAVLTRATLRARRKGARHRFQGRLLLLSVSTLFSL